MTIPTFEAPQIPLLERLLPAYEILGFVAKGSTGAIYRARQLSLDREVAIKILPHEIGGNADFRERFIAEARAMAKLNHPNLIGVYDFGEVEGMSFVVMEYVHGRALHFSANGKCIEQLEAAALALGICEGLAHAHEAGILHRDIKPANILLDPERHPKISNFGLACAIGSSEGTDELCGTPGYSAPEITSSPKTVDPRSDVYSIGVLFYELLTSELPSTPHVPAAQKASVDPKIDQLISKAIHPSPSHRFRDAEEMAKELRMILKGLSKRQPVAFKTAGSPSKATATAGDRSATQSPPLVGVSSNTNWPLMRNLLIIAALLGAIFVVYGALKSKEAENLLRQAEYELDQQEIDDPISPKVHPSREKPGNAKPKPNLLLEPKETPLQALGRLKPFLARGERTIFPPETLESDDLRYFYVETPMTWQEAAAFAEDHGGHLATAPNDVACDLLSSKVSGDNLVWLGGGSVGRNRWGWIDGSAWTGRMPSSGAGKRPVLTEFGAIKVQAGTEQYPFFIQWRIDGSNPGSLLVQLKRTKETLGGPTPAYPPGTFYFESRRYLVVHRQGSWKEASLLASHGGGHLGVPSDESENEILMRDLSIALGDGSTCWIGMQRVDEVFAWTTGEAWNFGAWAPHFPKQEVPSGSVGRFLTGGHGGWQHVNGADGSEAFIIEWSDDHKNGRLANVPAAFGKLKELQEQARNGIGNERSKYQDEIKKNTDGLRFKLGGWPRKQIKGVRLAWEPLIPKIEESIDMNGRFAWKGNVAPNLHGDLAAMVDDCITEQNKDDNDLRLNLERLRRLYLGYLGKEAENLRLKNLKGEVQRFDNEIAACSDLERFLDHFDLEQLPGAIEIAGPSKATKFSDWVRSVRFQSSDRTQVFVDGNLMRQAGSNGVKMSGFGPAVQSIEEDQQTVYWLFGGKQASIVVDHDRMGGVWTRAGGKQLRVTVVQVR